MTSRRSHPPTGARAITVLGPIPAAEVGFTMMHEHLLVRVPRFIEFEEASLRARQEAPVKLENLGWIRQYWTYNFDNLVLDDEALAARELARFAAASGGTVVDLTLEGIGRDPSSLARISRATGVHIVMGCGAYVARTHPAWVCEGSIEAIADRLVREYEDGRPPGSAPASSARSAAHGL